METNQTRRTWRQRTMDTGTTAILWAGVLMAASGLGQLLEAVWETARKMG